MFGLSRRDRRTAATGNVLVVGNGIASLRFCEEAVACGLTRRCRITVIGGENLPAYDRVRLSHYVKERSSAPLVFHPAEWYAEHGIALHLGDPVAALFPEGKRITTASGRDLYYDELILATGSAPFVPPIPGVDLPGVFVYRTLGDLDEIIAAARSATSAAVIGGGLLGLEAAQALEHLGLKATIIERAGFPMPRQLNAAAGGMITRKVEELGLAFRGGFSTREIVPADGTLKLVAEDGASLSADLVVISAGISPNSGIAAEAGIHCGVRGGVIVDDQLVTSDPHIHAIGECALHRGQIYGLAAPAAAMARHVARKLAGRKTPSFGTPDLSTRLKMLGVEVIAIGNALERGETIEFGSEDGYRLITLNENRVPVGGIGIGAWPESSLVHGWYLEGRALRDRELASFVSCGLLDPAAADAGVTAWPDERLVCNCARVSKGALCHAMAKGACSPDALAAMTGASTVCGSCMPLLDELCGAPAGTRRGTAPVVLVVLGALALVAVAAVLIVRVPHAVSVESWNYRLDRFWSETLPKQVTGYSLLMVSLLGLLISLRKRFPGFRFGAFARWRAFHAAFGLVSLAVLFAHTGFRFGANLNATLMAAFTGLNLLGALAGIAAGLEARGGPRAAMFSRRVRPGLTVAHYVFFWPLPVLLAFHIASAYLY